MKGSSPYVSGDYASANPDWHAEDAPFKADAVARLLKEQGVVPATVIDVGCGSGDVLRVLQGHLDPVSPDTRYEGWDIAPQAIGRATPAARRRFVSGDLLASEARADVVLCLDVFEHVADEVAFLRALRRHGDRFVFRIPLDLSVRDVARPDRLLDARRRFGHRHAYERSLAHAVLAEAGYTVLAERYHRVPPRPTAARSRITDGLRAALVRVVPHAAVRWLGGYGLLVLAR